MKTVKFNVFKLQQEWMEQHENADLIEVNSVGEPIRAVYISPIKQWEGHVFQGVIEVPDVDYYGSAQRESMTTKRLLDIAEGKRDKRSSQS